MADTKITALTAITTVDPAADVLPIVDVSDTSMAASGTTKKITSNQILGAGGTATLASATITGDLTVDTSTLYVSSSADKVGIGTTSLSNEKLTVSGNISANAWLGRSNISAPAGDCSIFRSADNTLGFGIASSTAMTLNSTGLGVGVSPTVKLDVSSTSTGIARFVNNLTSTYVTWKDGTSDVGYVGSGASFLSGLARTEFGIASAGSLVLGSNNARSVTIDTSGNVGIGVTPAGTGGCLQLKSGITFPATQVASSDANTLDDYEEGTFTPTIAGTTSAGTGTYSIQTGFYTKIGNTVFFRLRIDWSAHTGTGNMIIGNLPFVSSSTANSFSSVSIGYLNNIALTASSIATAFVGVNQAFVTLHQYASGGGASSAIPIDTDGAIMVSGSYIV